MNGDVRGPYFHLLLYTQRIRPKSARFWPSTPEERREKHRKTPKNTSSRRLITPRSRQNFTHFYCSHVQKDLAYFAKDITVNTSQCSGLLKHTQRHSCKARGTHSRRQHAKKRGMPAPWLFFATHGGVDHFVRGAARTDVFAGSDRESIDFQLGVACEVPGVVHVRKDPKHPSQQPVIVEPRGIPHQTKKYPHGVLIVFDIMGALVHADRIVAFFWGQDHPLFQAIAPILFLQVEEDWHRWNEKLTPHSAANVKKMEAHHLPNYMGLYGHFTGACRGEIIPLPRDFHRQCHDKERVGITTFLREQHKKYQERFKKDPKFRDAVRLRANIDAGLQCEVRPLATKGLDQLRAIFEFRKGINYSGGPREKVQVSSTTSLGVVRCFVTNVPKIQKKISKT